MLCGMAQRFTDGSHGAYEALAVAIQCVIWGDFGGVHSKDLDVQQRRNESMQQRENILITLGLLD